MPKTSQQKSYDKGWEDDPQAQKIGLFTFYHNQAKKLIPPKCVPRPKPTLNIQEIKHPEHPKRLKQKPLLQTPIKEQGIDNLSLYFKNRLNNINIKIDSNLRNIPNRLRSLNEKKSASSNQNYEDLRTLSQYRPPLKLGLYNIGLVECNYDNLKQQKQQQPEQQIKQHLPHYKKLLNIQMENFMKTRSITSNERSKAKSRRSKQSLSQLDQEIAKCEECLLENQNKDKGRKKEIYINSIRLQANGPYHIESAEHFTNQQRFPAVRLYSRTQNKKQIIKYEQISKGPGSLLKIVLSPKAQVRQCPSTLSSPATTQPQQCYPQNPNNLNDIIHNYFSKQFDKPLSSNLYTLASTDYY